MNRDSRRRSPQAESSRRRRDRERDRKNRSSTDDTKTRASTTNDAYYPPASTSYEYPTNTSRIPNYAPTDISTLPPQQQQQPQSQPQSSAWLGQNPDYYNTEPPAPMPHSRDQPPNPRARAPSSSGSSSGSSSEFSIVDISRRYDTSRFGGAFSAFFRAPSEHRRLRRVKNKAKKRAVFPFSNSSSSSLNSDLAYGDGYLSQKKSSKRRSKSASATPAQSAKPTQRQTDDEIVNIGRQLSDLARAQNDDDLKNAGRGHRGSKSMSAAAGLATLGAMSKSRKDKDNTRGIGSSKQSRRRNSDDDDWEDASDDESDESSDAATELAYGGGASTSNLPGFLGGAAATAGAASWFGSNSRRDSKDTVDPRKFGPVNSLHGMVTPLPFNDDRNNPQQGRPYDPRRDARRYEDARDSAEQIPMREVFPVTTSRPDLVDARHSSSIAGSRNDLPQVARPGPAPIQAPVPITPVSSKVYDAEKLEEVSTREPRDLRRESEPRGMSSSTKMGFGAAATAAMAAAAFRSAGARGKDEDYRSYSKTAPRRLRRGDSLDLQRRESERDAEVARDLALEARAEKERRERERDREDREKEMARQYEREQRKAKGSSSSSKGKGKETDDRSSKRSSRHDDFDDEYTGKKSDKGKEKEYKSSKRDRDEIKVEHDDYDKPSRDEQSRRSRKEEKAPADRDLTRDLAMGAMAAGGAALASGALASGSGSSEPPARPLTPSVFTVDREPNFDDWPPRSPSPDTRLSRKDSFEIEKAAEDDARQRSRSGHDYQDEHRADKSMYDHVKHATVPVAAAAVAAAVGIEAARGRGRKRDEYSDDGSRDRSRPETRGEKDAVQEEADRFYRESQIARKIAEEQVRSRSSSKNRGKDAREDEPEVVTIVTPPGYEEEEKKKVDKSPYDAPNADVLIDYQIYPAETSRFRSFEGEGDAPVWKSRDPIAKQDRPLINLVLPSPLPSRQTTPAPPQEPEPEPETQRFEPSSKSDKKDKKKDKKKSKKSKDRSSPPEGPVPGVDVVIGPKGDIVSTPTTPKSVSWGENDTRRYEPESPESERRSSTEKERPRLNKASKWGILAAAIAGSSTEPANEPEPVSSDLSRSGKSSPPRDRSFDDFGNEPPVPGPKPTSSETRGMPGGFGDDIEFAGTLAAGLQDSGFDPSIVVDDPAYHRRDSPPGSDELHDEGFYNKSYSRNGENVYAAGDPMTPGSGFVIGETETPKEKGQDDWASTSKLSKKEKRKQEKSAKDRGFAAFDDAPVADSTEATPLDEFVDAPALSKKEQKKRDKAAKAKSLEGGDDDWQSATAGTETPPSWAAGEDDFGDSKSSKKKNRKSKDYSDLDGDKVTVPVDAFDDLRSTTSRDFKADDEWDSSKKSKKKSKSSVSGIDSPSRPSSEVGSETSSRKKSKRRSMTDADFDEWGEPPDRKRGDPFEERDVSSVVSESRTRSKRSSRFDDDDTRSLPGGRRSSRYFDDDDDAKSVASAPGDATRKSKDKKLEKRSSGIFSGLFSRSNGSKDKLVDKKESKESFLGNAGTLGAGVGLAGAAAAVITAVARQKATEASSDTEHQSIEQLERARDVDTYDDDAEIAAHPIKPAIDPQYGDLLPLPPSEPPSPSPRESFEEEEEMPELPDSRPDTPPDERNLRIEERRAHVRRRSAQETFPKSPSRTAIPLQLRLGSRPSPGSPGAFKSSPLNSPDATGSHTKRAARPTSWEGSRQPIPLQLPRQVRHGSFDAAQETDLLAIGAGSDPVQGLSGRKPIKNPGLRIDTEVTPAHLPGSQETTPKAETQPDFIPVTTDEPSSDILYRDLQDASSVQPDQSQSPDPVDPMSKKRSSYLLNSAPSSTRSNRSVDPESWTQDSLDSTPSKSRGLGADLSDIPEDLTSADEHFTDAPEAASEADVFEEAHSTFSSSVQGGSPSQTTPTRATFATTMPTPLDTTPTPTESEEVRDSPLSKKAKKKKKKAAKGAADAGVEFETAEPSGTTTPVAETEAAPEASNIEAPAVPEAESASRSLATGESIVPDASNKEIPAFQDAADSVPAEIEDVGTASKSKKKKKKKSKGAIDLDEPKTESLEDITKPEVQSTEAAKEPMYYPSAAGLHSTRNLATASDNSDDKVYFPSAARVLPVALPLAVAGGFALKNHLDNKATEATEPAAEKQKDLDSFEPVPSEPLFSQGEEVLPDTQRDLMSQDPKADESTFVTQETEPAPADEAAEDLWGVSSSSKKKKKQNKKGSATPTATEEPVLAESTANEPGTENAAPEINVVENAAAGENVEPAVPDNQEPVPEADAAKDFTIDEPLEIAQEAPAKSVDDAPGPDADMPAISEEPVEEVADPSSSSKKKKKKKKKGAAALEDDQPTPLASEEAAQSQDIAASADTPKDEATPEEAPAQDAASRSMDIDTTPAAVTLVEDPTAEKSEPVTTSEPPLVEQSGTDATAPTEPVEEDWAAPSSSKTKKKKNKKGSVSTTPAEAVTHAAVDGASEATEAPAHAVTETTPDAPVDTLTDVTTEPQASNDHISNNAGTMQEDQPTPEATTTDNFEAPSTETRTPEDATVEDDWAASSAKSKKKQKKNKKALEDNAQAETSVETSDVLPAQSEDRGLDTDIVDAPTSQPLEDSKPQDSQVEAPIGPETQAGAPIDEQIDAPTANLETPVTETEAVPDTSSKKKKKAKKAAAAAAAAAAVEALAVDAKSEDAPKPDAEVPKDAQVDTAPAQGVEETLGEDQADNPATENDQPSAEVSSKDIDVGPSPAESQPALQSTDDAVSAAAAVVDTEPAVSSKKKKKDKKKKKGTATDEPEPEALSSTSIETPAADAQVEDVVAPGEAEGPASEEAKTSDVVAEPLQNEPEAQPTQPVEDITKAPLSKKDKKKKKKKTKDAEAEVPVAGEELSRDVKEVSEQPTESAADQAPAVGEEASTAAPDDDWDAALLKEKDATKATEAELRGTDDAELAPDTTNSQDDSQPAVAHDDEWDALVLPKEGEKNEFQEGEIQPWGDDQHADDAATTPAKAEPALEHQPAPVEDDWAATSSSKKDKKKKKKAKAGALGDEVVLSERTATETATPAEPEVSLIPETTEVVEQSAVDDDESGLSKKAKKKKKKSKTAETTDEPEADSRGIETTEATESAPIEPESAWDTSAWDDQHNVVDYDEAQPAESSWDIRPQADHPEAEFFAEADQEIKEEDEDSWDVTALKNEKKQKKGKEGDELETVEAAIEEKDVGESVTSDVPAEAEATPVEATDAAPAAEGDEDEWAALISGSRRTSAIAPKDIGSEDPSADNTAGDEAVPTTTQAGDDISPDNIDNITTEDLQQEQSGTAEESQMPEGDKSTAESQDAKGKRPLGVGDGSGESLQQESTDADQGLAIPATTKLSKKDKKKKKKGKQSQDDGAVEASTEKVGDDEKSAQGEQPTGTSTLEESQSGTDKALPWEGGSVEMRKEEEVPVVVDAPATTDEPVATDAPVEAASDVEAPKEISETATLSAEPGTSTPAQEPEAPADHTAASKKMSKKEKRAEKARLAALAAEEASKPAADATTQVELPTTSVAEEVKPETTVEKQEDDQPPTAPAAEEPAVPEPETITKDQPSPPAVNETALTPAVVEATSTPEPETATEDQPSTSAPSMDPSEAEAAEPKKMSKKEKRAEKARLAALAAAGAAVGAAAGAASQEPTSTEEATKDSVTDESAAVATEPQEPQERFEVEEKPAEIDVPGNVEHEPAQSEEATPAEPSTEPPVTEKETTGVATSDAVAAPVTQEPSEPDDSAAFKNMSKKEKRAEKARLAALAAEKAAADEQSPKEPAAKEQVTEEPIPVDTVQDPPKEATAEGKAEKEAVPANPGQDASLTTAQESQVTQEFEATQEPPKTDNAASEDKPIDAATADSTAVAPASQDTSELDDSVAPKKLSKKEKRAEKARLAALAAQEPVTRETTPAEGAKADESAAAGDAQVTEPPVNEDNKPKEPSVEDSAQPAEPTVEEPTTVQEPQENETAKPDEAKDAAPEAVDSSTPQDSASQDPEPADEPDSKKSKKSKKKAKKAAQAAALVSEEPAPEAQTTTEKSAAIPDEPKEEVPAAVDPVEAPIEPLAESPARDEMPAQSDTLQAQEEPIAEALAPLETSVPASEDPLENVATSDETPPETVTTEKTTQLEDSGSNKSKKKKKKATEAARLAALSEAKSPVETSREIPEEPVVDSSDRTPDVVEPVSVSEEAVQSEVVPAVEAETSSPAEPINAAEEIAPAIQEPTPAAEERAIAPEQPISSPLNEPVNKLSKKEKKKLEKAAKLAELSTPEEPSTTGSDPAEQTAPANESANDVSLSEQSIPAVATEDQVTASETPALESSEEHTSVPTESISEVAAPEPEEAAPEGAAPAISDEPAPKLSKKQQKKAEKAAKLAALAEADTSSSAEPDQVTQPVAEEPTSAAEPVSKEIAATPEPPLVESAPSTAEGAVEAAKSEEPTPPVEDPAPADAPMVEEQGPKLSKKEKKRLEKAAKLAALSASADESSTPTSTTQDEAAQGPADTPHVTESSAPEVAVTSEVEPPVDTSEPPTDPALTTEVEAGTESETPKLSKKEKKKAEKAAKLAALAQAEESTSQDSKLSEDVPTSSDQEQAERSLDPVDPVEEPSLEKPLDIPAEIEVPSDKPTDSAVPEPTATVEEPSAPMSKKERKKAEKAAKLAAEAAAKESPEQEESATSVPTEEVSTVPEVTSVDTPVDSADTADVPAEEEAPVDETTPPLSKKEKKKAEKAAKLAALAEAESASSVPAGPVPTSAAEPEGIEVVAQVQEPEHGSATQELSKADEQTAGQAGEQADVAAPEETIPLGETSGDATPITDAPAEEIPAAETPREETSLQASEPSTEAPPSEIATPSAESEESTPKLSKKEKKKAEKAAKLAALAAATKAPACTDAEPTPPSVSPVIEPSQPSDSAANIKNESIEGPVDASKSLGAAVTAPEPAQDPVESKKPTAEEIAAAEAAAAQAAADDAEFAALTAKKTNKKKMTTKDVRKLNDLKAKIEARKAAAAAEEELAAKKAEEAAAKEAERASQAVEKEFQETQSEVDVSVPEQSAGQSTIPDAVLDNTSTPEPIEGEKTAVPVATESQDQVAVEETSKVDTAAAETPTVDTSQEPAIEEEAPKALSKKDKKKAKKAAEKATSVVEPVQETIPAEDASPQPTPSQEGLDSAPVAEEAVKTQEFEPESQPAPESTVDDLAPKMSKKEKEKAAREAALLSEDPAADTSTILDSTPHPTSTIDPAVEPSVEPSGGSSVEPAVEEQDIETSQLTVEPTTTAPDTQDHDVPAGAGETSQIPQTEDPVAADVVADTTPIKKLSKKEQKKAEKARLAALAAATTSADTAQEEPALESTAAPGSEDIAVPAKEVLSQSATPQVEEPEPEVLAAEEPLQSEPIEPTAEDEAVPTKKLSKKEQKKAEKARLAALAAQPTSEESIQISSGEVVSAQPEATDEQAPTAISEEPSAARVETVPVTEEVVADQPLETMPTEPVEEEAAPTKKLSKKEQKKAEKAEKARLAALAAESLEPETEPAAAADKMSEEERPVEDMEAVAEDKAVEEVKLVEQENPIEKGKHVEDEKPVEEVKLIEKDTPTEDKLAETQEVPAAAEVPSTEEEKLPIKKLSKKEQKKAEKARLAALAAGESLSQNDEATTMPEILVEDTPLAVEHPMISTEDNSRSLDTAKPYVEREVPIAEEPASIVEESIAESATVDMPTAEAPQPEQEPAAAKKSSKKEQKKAEKARLAALAAAEALEDTVDKTMTPKAEGIVPAAEADVAQDTVKITLPEAEEEPASVAEEASAPMVKEASAFVEEETSTKTNETSEAIQSYDATPSVDEWAPTKKLSKKEQKKAEKARLTALAVSESEPAAESATGSVIEIEPAAEQNLISTEPTIATQVVDAEPEATQPEQPDNAPVSSAPTETGVIDELAPPKKRSKKEQKKAEKARLAALAAQPTAQDHETTVVPTPEELASEELAPEARELDTLRSADQTPDAPVAEAASDVVSTEVEVAAPVTSAESEEATPPKKLSKKEQKKADKAARLAALTPNDEAALANKSDSAADATPDELAESTRDVAEDSTAKESNHDDISNLDNAPSQNTVPLVEETGDVGQEASQGPDPVLEVEDAKPMSKKDKKKAEKKAAAAAAAADAAEEATPAQPQPEPMPVVETSPWQEPSSSPAVLDEPQPQDDNWSLDTDKDDSKTADKLSKAAAVSAGLAAAGAIGAHMAENLQASDKSMPLAEKQDSQAFGPTEAVASTGDDDAPNAHSSKTAQHDIAINDNSTEPPVEAQLAVDNRALPSADMDQTSNDDLFAEPAVIEEQTPVAPSSGGTELPVETPEPIQETEAAADVVWATPSSSKKLQKNKKKGSRSVTSTETLPLTSSMPQDAVTASSHDFETSDPVSAPMETVVATDKATDPEASSITNDKFNKVQSLAAGASTSDDLPSADEMTRGMAEIPQFQEDTSKADIQDMPLVKDMPTTVHANEGAGAAWSTEPTSIYTATEDPSTVPGLEPAAEKQSSLPTVDTTSQQKESVSRSMEAAGVAVAAAGTAAVVSEGAPSKTASKKANKKKKIIDKRQPQDDDIFDDPVLWESADKKGIEREEMPKQVDEFSKQQGHDDESRKEKEKQTREADAFWNVGGDEDDGNPVSAEVDVSRDSGENDGKEKAEVRMRRAPLDEDMVSMQKPKDIREHLEEEGRSPTRDLKPAAKTSKEALITPQSESFSGSDGGWKETARQGVRLDEHEFEESPTLGRGESDPAKMAPIGLLRERSDAEESVGNLLREESQPRSLTSMVPIEAAEDIRRSPSRGLPVVPEVPETEPEPDTRAISRVGPDFNRDSGYVAGSPRPMSHDSAAFDKHNEIQRDSGVHTGDWDDHAPRTPASRRDSRLRDSPQITPRLIEPPLPSVTPEPEKRATSKNYGSLEERPTTPANRITGSAAAAGLVAAATASALRTPESERSVSGDHYKRSREKRGSPPASTVSLGHEETTLRRTLSNTSLVRQRTPEALNFRPDSPGIRPTPTPPLRRVNRRISTELSSSPSAPGLRDTESPKPTANETKVRVRDKDKDMTDVYDGFGEGRIGSPRSPTRPHSMRRRQSMQVLELESRVEQLLAENRLLTDARAHAEQSQSSRSHNALSERDAEIDSLKQSLQFLQNEVNRLTEVNDGLTTANAELASKDNSRYADLAAGGLAGAAGGAAATSAGYEKSLEEKDAEIADLKAQLADAKEKVREMQRQVLASKQGDSSFLNIYDEDHFDARCQQLCSHVQQWVLRFSKFSDMRACRLTSEINDEKTIDRLDNAVLDGTDVDVYLNDRVKRRDIFMSMTMNMIWEFIFTRYLFGMDREQRQKLKSLEKILTEVGPAQAVRQWRAVTLTLLARRQVFKTQRDQDTEAVVQAVYQTLCKILPPPSNLEGQIQSQLRRVMAEAVDLSIQMRTQKAEYMMLPPLQPEYDADGELAASVYFNASMMNERSNSTGQSNEELEAQGAKVRIVLFPLVVKKGDDTGVGDEEIVVCPAQVLVPRSGRRSVAPSSDAGGASLLGAPSRLSVVTDHMG